MENKNQKNTKPDDPEESARFIETAEKLELVDDPEKAFQKAMEKIAKKKPKPKEEG